MIELNDRERRLVRWGAIIAVIVLPVIAFRPYHAKLVDMQAQLEFERDALVRERASIAASKRNPELQHIADSLMQTAEPRLFVGRDDVMASAELVWYLDEVAGKHHVMLNEDATRTAAKPKNGVRTLNVDIRGESDLHGVLEFLQALERGPKQLRVSRLDISKPSRDADDVETVTFGATVSGYALAVGAPPSVSPRRSATSKADSVTTAARGAP